jgi:uncharacterized membrane protein YfcA
VHSATTGAGRLADVHEPAAVLALLAGIGLVAGVGITAVGPGGVLVTIGLFLLTDRAPASVAGTAIVTHVATGLLGALAYRRSGHLGEPGTRRIAAVLAATALVGAPAGVALNLTVPGRVFGVALATFVLLVAALVWHRGRRFTDDDHHPHHATAVLLTGGLAIAAASGLFGVGGPLLSVPLLVALGTPVLAALAAAQVQSIVIASTGTVGYLLDGSVDWRLAAVVGLPELAGVLLGWQVARRVPARRLRAALVAALVAVAPLLVLRP